MLSSIKTMLVFVPRSGGWGSADFLDTEVVYEDFAPLSYFFDLSVEELEGRFISSELMNLVALSKNSAMVVTDFHGKYKHFDSLIFPMSKSVFFVNL